MAALGRHVRSTTLPTKYTVVTACHADETAGECQLPLGSGRHHGFLTYCLLELLKQNASDALGRLRFCDIWERLKESLLQNGAKQHPQLLGPPERRIFGGHWQQQDPGYPIRRNSDGSIELLAGSLVGLGPGSEVAVYGPEPARFPPLGSSADLAARRGLLIVERVTAAHSVCRAEPHGAEIDVTGGARGRLVKPGAPQRLRVAVSSLVEPGVLVGLNQYSSWDRYVVVAQDDPTAEAQVGQLANGDLWIGDDLYAPNDTSSPGPIGLVQRSEAADTSQLVSGLRAGLNHYAQYVIPLRLYRHAGSAIPERALSVRLIDCNALSAPQQLEYDAQIRREAPKDTAGRYSLRNGDQVAIHIDNSHRSDLFVFVLLCNMEGQIQLVDSDVLVKAHSGKLFWCDSVIGGPFELFCPEAYPWGLDRLVVVASDQKGLDLGSLRQERTMQQVIATAMGSRNIGRPTTSHPPGLNWTAAQAVIRVDS
jgi:hypothetical protein